jgi:Domain of unknown function (DUF1906)
MPSREWPTTRISGDLIEVAPGRESSVVMAESPPRRLPSSQPVSGLVSQPIYYPALVLRCWPLRLIIHGPRLRAGTQPHPQFILMAAFTLFELPRKGIAVLKGIDFSEGNGLTTAQISDAGYAFVCRYLSGGLPKDIDGLELSNYKAAGIRVVFVWESGGLMPSEAQGVADARSAQAELEGLASAVKDSSVARAPVFFAADASAEADLPGYLQGAGSVIGKARTAIYGGYSSVNAAFNAGLVAFGWQTYAWSNGQWDDRALLRQVQNGAQLGPAQVDIDQAAFWNSAKVLGMHDNFGQWPSPTPAAPRQGPYRHVVPKGNTETIGALAASRNVSVSFIVSLSQKLCDEQNGAVMSAFLALDSALAAAGCPPPAMPEGLVYYTVNP